MSLHYTEYGDTHGRMATLLIVEWPFSGLFEGITDAGLLPQYKLRNREYPGSGKEWLDFCVDP